jgi:hypothetical protein
MHIEATRLITAWLNHPTYGVNAQVAAVARNRFGDVEAEADPEPKAVVLFNDVDFDEDMDESVLGINPPILPALVVVFDVNPKGIDVDEVEKTSHQYNMVGAVAYYAEDGINRMLARREGGYVMRAVGRSLTRYNLGRLSSPRSGTNYRILNGIKLVRITNLTFQRPAGGVPASQMMGIVFLDVIVQDQAP